MARHLSRKVRVHTVSLVSLTMSSMEAMEATCASIANSRGYYCHLLGHHRSLTDIP